MLFIRTARRNPVTVATSGLSKPCSGVRRGEKLAHVQAERAGAHVGELRACLLYTSDAADDTPC
eukprot:8666731-Pyramimonas_sp.AAC.1